MAKRLTRVVLPVGTGLVALVLSHSIVYLVRYGSAYGEALAHNGHGTDWTIAVWASIGLGIGLTLAGATQLLRLTRTANATWSLDSRGAFVSASGRLDVGAFVRAWLRSAARVSLATAILLTIQENVERAGVGIAMPGLGLLVSPEYPWAVAIVAGVALAVGFVVALFRWQRDRLVARIAAARRAALAGATATSSPRIPWVEPRHASITGHLVAGRAPPSVVAA
jgi:hypothetical protein